MTTPHELKLRARPDLVAHHSNGSWNHTSLWVYGDRAVRVRLDIDHSYSWQSYLGVEFLTPVGWKELHRMLPSQSASQQHSSYKRPFPTPALQAAALTDEQTLLDIAVTLLATLEGMPHAQP